MHSLLSKDLGIIPMPSDMLTVLWKLQVCADDQGVVKHTLQEGEGWETPRAPFEIRVACTVRCWGHSEPLLEVPRDKPLEVTVGAGQLCPGLELGINEMTLGERALISLKPAHVAPCPLVPALKPAMAGVEVEVELLSMVQVGGGDRAPHGQGVPCHGSP